MNVLMNLYVKKIDWDNDFQESIELIKEYEFLVIDLEDIEIKSLYNKIMRIRDGHISNNVKYSNDSILVNFELIFNNVHLDLNDKHGVSIK